MGQFDGPVMSGGEKGRGGGEEVGRIEYTDWSGRASGGRSGWMVWLDETGGRKDAPLKWCFGTVELLWG